MAKKAPAKKQKVRARIGPGGPSGWAARQNERTGQDIMSTVRLVPIDFAWEEAESEFGTAWVIEFPNTPQDFSIHLEWWTDDPDSWGAAEDSSAVPGYWILGSYNERTNAVSKRVRIMDGTQRDWRKVLAPATVAAVKMLAEDAARGGPLPDTD